MQPNVLRQAFAATRMLSFSLALLAIALIPLWPNWVEQVLPATHEWYRYMLLADWFANAQSSGIFYPRWLPQMNGGFGYPQFVFYQPGYFFLHSWTVAVTDDFLLRQLLTLSLIAFLGGLGTYCLARCFVAPGAALVLVMLFQIAPYSHINLYVRGDLSEWMVLQLLPWPFFFLFKFIGIRAIRRWRERALTWLGLSLSTALVCYCHPVALLFLPLLLCVAGGLCLWRSQSSSSSHVKQIGMELICAILLGLVLSSPYWLSVVMMKPFANTKVALIGQFEAWKNTASLFNILFGSFGNPKTFNGTEFIGAPFALLALAGAWFGRRIPPVFAAGLMYMAIVVLITPAGQWLWRIYPFLLIQFPWRLAVFVPLLQTLCMLGFWQIPIIYPGFPKKSLAIGLAGAVGILVAWSPILRTGFKPLDIVHGHALTQQELLCLQDFAQIALPGTYLTTLDAGEWQPANVVRSLPSTARGAPGDQGCQSTQRRVIQMVDQAGHPPVFGQSDPRPWVEVMSANWAISPLPGASPYNLASQMKGSEATSVVINQLYLPGWRIMVDDQPLTRQEIERRLMPDGRMRIDLTPGNHSIQAWYDGPLYWQVRDFIIGLAIMTALAYWLRQWRATRGCFRDRLTGNLCEQNNDAA
ncbi:MAG: hypothetical protein NT087_06550 [Deltaproteobacteria bacterium]|nr:hypothetical protein [Deltaproteobacteria bacterium]